MGVSSISNGGSSAPQSSDDLNTVETKIAQGTASPLLGLQDWSSQGILDRLTGTDGVLPGAQVIQQQAVATGMPIPDASAIPDPNEEESSAGSSTATPSSSASSTVSASASA